jgi:hypothetical protein
VKNNKFNNQIARNKYQQSQILGANLVNKFGKISLHFKFSIKKTLSISKLAKRNSEITTKIYYFLQITFLAY